MSSQIAQTACFHCVSFPVV